MFQLREGLSNRVRHARARCGAGETCRPRFRSYVWEASSIEDRLACTLAGSSCNSLGGEPRGPNQVLNSHNAVVLASAKTRLGTGAMYLSSSGSLAAPNSVSSKRRSISYWSRATASRVAAHAGADWAEVQYLALILIRLDARTTAGPQTATETKPRRN